MHCGVEDLIFWGNSFWNSFAMITDTGGRSGPVCVCARARVRMCVFCCNNDLFMAHTGPWTLETSRERMRENNNGRKGNEIQKRMKRMEENLIWECSERKCSFRFKKKEAKIPTSGLVINTRLFGDKHMNKLAGS